MQPVAEFIKTLKQVQNLIYFSVDFSQNVPDSYNFFLTIRPML